MSSFFPVNKVDQTKKQRNFDIKQFNKNFDDLLLLKTIDGGLIDNIKYDNAEEENVIEKIHKETKKKDYNETIIDPKLAKNKNYYNPYIKETYIDPRTNCTQRFVLFALVNKFNKKIFVFPTYRKNIFVIPGNYPKIFENTQNAAVRNFEQQTGIYVDKRKITKLVQKPVQINNQQKLICTTYIAYVFDETSYFLRPEYKKWWISIKKLTKYNDLIFHYYYRAVYFAILQHIY